MNIKQMIEEWKKGCSVSKMPGFGNPEDCTECTVALIEAIEKEYERMVQENPAEILRHIAEDSTKGTNLEVDKQSFDKAAEVCNKEVNKTKNKRDVFIPDKCELCINDPDECGLTLDLGGCCKGFQR